MKTTAAALMALFCISCANYSTAGGHQARLGFYADSDAIIAELKDKKKTYHDYFLLGQAYRDKQQYKDAIFNFANSCFARHSVERLTIYASPVYHYINGFHIKSPLYDEALYEIADLFMQYREYAFVIKFTAKISRDMPGLWFEGRILMAQAQAELERFDHAMKTYQELLAAGDKGSSRQLVFIKIASLYEKQGLYEQSLESYGSVLGIDADSWQGQLAARRMAHIAATRSLALPEACRVKTARGLYGAGDYQNALDVLSQTTPPEQDDEKNEYLVRVLVRLNRESRAEALVEGHAARRQRLLDLRMVMADELWSARKRNAALKIYRTMAELGVEPHAQKALGRAAIYLSDNSMAGADALLVKYKDTYSDDTAELCLWRLAKSALQKKDQARATAMLTESLDAFPLGPGSGRARFWLHRLSRDRNDRDRAREYFKGMVVNNPDSLYTWQLIDHEAAALESRELLAEFHQALRNGDADSAVFHYGLLVYRGDQPSEPGAAPLSMKTLQEPYEKLEKQIASRSLLSSSSGVLTSLEKYFMIGDQTAINRELRFLPHGDAIKDDSLVALAHYSRKYGQHNLAINSLLDLLRHRGLRENLFLSPRPLMEQLFPRGFSRCVTANASANNLDPNYVYAVIKAESNFSHTAVSSAGAVGLMQLMPATAADIARGLKIDRYDLKNPCTSIQFGSRYLGWLMRFFNNNISLAIGGYNAGPGNIVKWRKDLPVDDLDYFIEFVPFSETRGYMLRTSKFFRQYTLLYGR